MKGLRTIFKEPVITSCTVTSNDDRLYTRYRRTGFYEKQVVKVI